MKCSHLKLGRRGISSIRLAFSPEATHYSWFVGKFCESHFVRR
jgi:hypothetical protein